MRSSDGFLIFDSDDKIINKEISLSSINKVDNLKRLVRLENRFLFIITPIVVLLLFFLEWRGYIIPWLYPIFFTGFVITLVIIYFKARFGLTIHFLDDNDIVTSSEFTGYRQDIRSLIRYLHNTFEENRPLRF
ncbi:MAG: hypothetical protein GPJ54_03240 [Candidatus Heimdallarchaeota archaeon]|nr:hypothetical protein [Candidatus Heimdallarchaeota archaeon]